MPSETNSSLTKVQRAYGNWRFNVEYSNSLRKYVSWSGKPGTFNVLPDRPIPIKRECDIESLAVWIYVINETNAVSGVLPRFSVLERDNSGY